MNYDDSSVMDGSLSAGSVPLLQVSAPGKVILFGEHSVLYGKPAIAAAVSLRTKLQLYSCPGWVSLHLPDIQLCNRWPLTEICSWLDEVNHLLPKTGGDCWKRSQRASKQLRQQLAAVITRRSVTRLSGQHVSALSSFLYVYACLCPDRPGLHVRVLSQLPAGAGLGSSAAYGVSLVTALIYRRLYYLNRSSGTGRSALSHVLATDGEELPPVYGVGEGDLGDPGYHDQKEFRHEVRPSVETRAIISGWALASDDIIHGQASGIDNTVCTYGGALKFHSGKIQTLETAQLMQVLLVDTRVPRNTCHLVEKVRSQLVDPALAPIFEPILTSMQQVAESAVKAIASDDSATLCRLVDVNQGLLHALGVSHPALESVAVSAARHGLTAKLTGAGGGGFAIVPLPATTSLDTILQLKDELVKMDFEVYEVGIGGPGVTVLNLAAKC